MENIDESKIPINFSWRAGIGTDKPNNMNYQNEPLTLRDLYHIPKRPDINKNELYSSVLGETLRIIDSFLKPNYNKDLTYTEMVIIKSSIRNKIMESLKGYFKYLETDFIPYLRNSISCKETFYGMLEEEYIIDLFNSVINNKPLNDIMIND